MESRNAELAVCDTSLGSDGYACWQHPFRVAQIRMHPAPLRHLSNEALRRLKQKPESEIGGILWGRILPDSVIIEDARLIPANGSLYNTTPSDTGTLEKAIKLRPPNGLELVGYFRSHIRDGLCLSTQDQELITKYLRNPEYAILLIRPFEMGICMGAFFFWQNGQLQTDGSDLEVPFLVLDHHPVVEDEAQVDHCETDKSTDASEQHQNPVVSSSHTDPTLPIERAHWISQQPQKSPLPEKAKTRIWFPVIGIALLIAFIASTGAATYFGIPIFKAELLRLFGPLGINSVGLKVARGADGQLDITWNRKMLERAGARQAVLTISDGSISKRLLIDGVQLHSGTLTYFPAGLDIQFRFEINLNAGHSIAETVRVVLPPANRGKDLATSPAIRAVPPHARDSGSRKIDSTHPSVASRARFEAPTYTPARELLNLQSDRRQPRAPELHVDPVAVTYAFPSILAALPSPPPRLKAPLSPQSRTVAQERAPAPEPASAMPTAAHNTAAYVPPQPVRKVMPDSKLVRYALASQTGSVEVQVTINESGHVTDARPVHNGTKSSGLLANAAVTAARQWTFRPATLHGRPVAAEHLIIFNFESQ